MRTLLIVFCLTAFIATTFAQSCDSDTNAIANKLSGFAQRLTSCNTADLNTICDSSSDCRKAIRDLFAYAENCATQISGSGVNFAVLVDQWNQAITAACNSRPEDLLALYFGNCPNVNNLVNAAKKVLNDCTAAATCSDACRSSLNSYYKEIYACVSPNNEDANQDGIRHVFESLCQLVSAEQSCVQTLFANLHLVNDKCSGDGTFTCSSECSAAITSAFNTAAANCPLDAADILGQYDSACNADCGPNVDSAYSSISEACSPLSAVTPSQDDCTACVNAIADARTTSACLSLSTTSSDEVLSLLSDLATQACTVDVAAKDLANSDVFGSKARNAAASCRSGICDSECQSALNSLVSSVKDAYSPLSPPDSVRDDLNALKDICSQPAPGFSHRIDVVLSDINCNVILSYAQDYIYRFAQIFGLSPADLVIVDCSESSTRATDTTLTMGSANTPKKASTSSCDDVSLSCSKITTSSSTGSGSGSGSSPASTLFLSSFLVAISMIALWFF